MSEPYGQPEGVDYLVERIKKAVARPWLPIKDAPTDGTEIELYWAPRTKPRILNGKKIADEIVFARIRGIGKWSVPLARVNDSKGRHAAHFNLGTIQHGPAPVMFRYLDADPEIV